MKLRLFLSYCAIVLISSTLNLAFQEVTYRLAQHILPALIIGTGVGLLTKFYLDSRFIFKYKAPSAAHRVNTFALYSCMGGLTTMVFWGVELAFYHFVNHPYSHLMGGALGLALGNLIKYYLDKSFVFKRT